MRRMTMPDGSKPKPRRHRRHAKAPAPVTSPVQVVAQLRTAPQLAAPPEEPLSPQEIAKLKIHFRFLRDHRNVLKLRVNAAEDLLLNGVKEPSHRGLCQHLLAKVERSRVLTVSQSLPPLEASRLLAGVIRFAPEIGYVLRYLECVKVTSTQEQAGAAVTEALKQIDFASLSAAQMRQLVALIVDVFAKRDLPIFLFTLLRDKSFKAALDRSLDGFPEVLASMVRPLRALYEQIVWQPGKATRERQQGDQARAGSADVHAGVELLLAVHPPSLLGLPEATRRKLFYLGCETVHLRHDARAETLQQLLRSLNLSQETERQSATTALVSALLAVGQEAFVRKLLDRAQEPGESGAALQKWRQALDAPRVGTVAIDASRAGTELPPPGRLYRGWHVPSQSSVLIRYGNAGDRATYAEQVELWQCILAPGVSRVVAADPQDLRRPYIAVELQQGTPLHRMIRQHSQRGLRIQVRWAVEACAIFYALALQGIQIPDAQLGRFNCEANGRLWLVDLWQMRRVEPEQALLAHLELGRSCCRELFADEQLRNLHDELLERIASASDLHALARLLEVA